MSQRAYFRDRNKSLSVDYFKTVYAVSYLARAIDERFKTLFLTGRVAKWYSQVGNEITTVPVGLHMSKGDILSTLHRDLGAILAYYFNPADLFPKMGLLNKERYFDKKEGLFKLFSQLLGKGTGFSRGIERSFHYSVIDREKGFFHVGMISHLGAMIPVAAGTSFAAKLKNNGNFAVTFIGDGGTSTGDFHEGINLASVWNLPLIIIIENNQYAFSTPTYKQFRCEKLSDRAVGYGIKGLHVDGTNIDEVTYAVEEAIGTVLTGKGPVIIEAVLGRMRGHSEGDGSLKIVPEKDLQFYLSNDPLVKLKDRLLAEGMVDQDWLSNIEQVARDTIETILNEALEAPLSDVNVAMRPVFISSDLGENLYKNSKSSTSCKTLSYLDAIREALIYTATRDDRVYILGQDIAEYGGAFKVTRGLYQLFPGRVLDTPIAESGTLGAAAGMAIMGLRPVVEMQFADFVTCGFNQIVNVIAKMFYRWEIPCPIVVRLPSGDRVGAGPFHSQSPESWFTHCAGLKVVFPSTPQDAWSLLIEAIYDNNPVLFFEHKYLYRRIKDEVDFNKHVGIGKARVVTEGKDITVISYGATVYDSLEAAQILAKEGYQVEVIDLRTLIPFDNELVFESVKKTGKVIVVHESQLTGGFGAEVVSLITENCFWWLDTPPIRIAFPDRPVPFAKNLEAYLFPSTEKIVERAKYLLTS